MSNKYIGITFGPITRATENVKSTKALWASSYFFSYITREIIQPFRKRTFVYPIVDKQELWNSKNGIGCFPDRYVFQSEEGDVEKLKTQIDAVFKAISSQIALCITEDREEVYAFIKNYIKVCFFEKYPELIENVEAKEKPSLINVPEEFNKIFDLLEMQDTFNLLERNNYLLRFFESKELYKSFLVDDAFSKLDYFEALDRISKAEYALHRPIKHKAYHNYIAIISADGDHMTKTINQLLNDGREVVELSESLFLFGQEVIEGVNIKSDYGARVIFAGGDDLLIFAPIKYGEVTVFDLVEKLNTVFNNQMSCLPAPPTISFGIAIAYNKYPMGETLRQSKDFLDEAKNGHGRNAIVCQLQKHSGQRAKLFFKKNSQSYQEALKMIRTYTCKNALLLSSLTHWVGLNEQVLSLILNNAKNQTERLKQYFDSSLDESIHKAMGDFIVTVREYMLLVYSETNNTKETIETVTTLLRIIHFINTERDE